MFVSHALILVCFLSAMFMGCYFLLLNGAAYWRWVLLLIPLVNFVHLDFRSLLGALAALMPEWSQAKRCLSQAKRLDAPRSLRGWEGTSLLYIFCQSFSGRIYVATIRAEVQIPHTVMEETSSKLGIMHMYFFTTASRMYVLSTEHLGSTEPSLFLQGQHILFPVSFGGVSGPARLPALLLRCVCKHMNWDALDHGTPERMSMPFLPTL